MPFPCIVWNKSLNELALILDSMLWRIGRFFVQKDIFLYSMIDCTRNCLHAMSVKRMKYLLKFQKMADKQVQKVICGYIVLEKCIMPVLLFSITSKNKKCYPSWDIFKGVWRNTCNRWLQCIPCNGEKFPCIKVSGCWAHARRPFATVVKTLGKEKGKGTLANDALKQIAALFKLEKELAKLSPKERLRQRELTMKPLVEAFFVWVKKHQDEVLPQS